MEADYTSLITILIAAASGVYAFLHALVSLGLLRHQDARVSSASGNDVSILVAAHNEAEHIGRTLHALLNQTIQPREIVVVDDRSTDSTAEIVTSVAREHESIRLVSVTSLPAGLAPKKHALTLGIAASTGDILCFTDADCLPPPRWLERMLQAFDGQAGIVVGSNIPNAKPASTSSPLQKILRAFIRYEKVRSTALSAGSATLGFPWTSSGTSFAYRRKIFDEVDGFERHKTALSGDDDLLLHDVRTRTRWKVRVVIGSDAAVVTRVPTTFRDFVSQRRRHFSAGRRYRPSAQVLLGIYHLSHVLAVSSLPFAFILDSPVLAVSFIVKSTADLLLFLAAERHLHRLRDWAYFIPMEFLYAAYIVVVGPLGFFGKIVWRDSTTS